MWNDFLVGLQFLTRLHLQQQTDWSLESFGRSVKFFPIIGFIIGMIIFAIVWSCKSIIPIHVLAAIIVICEIVITGALHCDGFMDTMDGVFSGRPREKMLQIMKDSRVGAFGVVAFSCYLLLKVSIYLDLGNEDLLRVVFIAPVLGRFAMVYGIVRFPYAREDGMGKAFHQYSGIKSLFIALFCSLCVLVPLGSQAILSFIIVMIFTHIFAIFVTAKIGGLTGDIYGAITILAELLVSLVYLIV